MPQDLNSKAQSALEDLRIATAGTDPREELLRRAEAELSFTMNELQKRKEMT